MNSIDNSQSAIVIHVESSIKSLKARIAAKAKKRDLLYYYCVYELTLPTFDSNDYLVHRSRLEIIEAELASLRRLYALALSFRDRHITYASNGLGEMKGEHHG